MPLSMLHKSKKPLHEVLNFRKEKNGITIDIVLQWYVNEYSDEMRGFVNGISTNGGTHIDGVKASLTRTLNSLAKISKIFKDEDITLSEEHVMEGLTCVVSVRGPNLEFDGQKHKRLKNPYVGEIVDQSVQEYLTEYFKLHPDVFESIISKSLNAYKSGLALERAMGLIRSIPTSFSTEKPENVIGRGDSSGGAANHGPYKRLQTKRTREQPRTDGAALGESSENTISSDSSFEKKRQKLNSCVLPSPHSDDASNRKDVSDKKLKNLAPGSNKTRKCIPVGVSFQAELPVWIAPTRKGKFYGSPGDSDTLKWLGTRVWPTYSLEKTVHHKKVGEGRTDSCSCASPRSTTCIKHHIKEARELLEKELNRCFYTWKFDKMGEEGGSKLWTAKEEQKFEAFVKNNPLSGGEGFWKLASKAFPSKNEKDLHSYYYNVFLINRARLLAKFSPEDIDSDDDHHGDL